jgi:O-succinylbenzoic acid--CoA ligase
MKVWTSPVAPEIDLYDGVPARAASLAACRARFLVVPVDDNLDASRWALACFHSHVTFVPVPAGLPAPALERRLRQLPGDVAFPGSLAPREATALPPLRAKPDVWAVIFTSGTTGDPKGVALSGAALEASARAHAAHSGSADWLLDLPLYHVGGLSVLTRALFLGSALGLAAPRFSASSTAEWLASGRVRGISVVPTTLLRLLDAGADFSRLSIALLGGAPASPDLRARAVAAGVPVRATYGMTELASQIATETAPGDGLRPLPGVELSLDGEELLVRSSALAEGYYVNGALEPLPLRAGFFATSDLGELRGGRLTLFGRKSDVIITGGKKLHPAEIEAAIAALPGVGECAVVGIPDPEWGECAVAAVVTRDAFDERMAEKMLRKSLESWKLPKRWVRVDSLPRTPTGKVVRRELLFILSNCNN